MRIEKVKMGDKEVYPFTIPSGIITTQPSCLEKLAREIPELGVSTTKSIGPKPRQMPKGKEVKNPDPNKQYSQREPILCIVEGCPGTYGNNVGLDNPGAEKSAEQLERINFPEDKFLLASVFGRIPEELAYVAKTLENYVDGFEPNYGCPNVRRHGMAIGQDPDAVYEFTKATRQVTTKPIFPKLTPNTNQIGECSKAAIRAGANGLVLINTLGPGGYYFDGKPILTGKVGGISGRAIKPIGLKCVREARQAVGGGVPMIVMGGISNARDIKEYAEAVKGGPVIFGIGSAHAGMTDEQIGKFYPALIDDLKTGDNTASQFLQEVDMKYQKARITDKIDRANDFKIFRTNIHIKAEPGQFVFAWLPEVGEKPLYILDDCPLTLGIQRRGEFTKAINKLEKGDSFNVRGPYGKGVNLNKQGRPVLVADNWSIAGISLMAKEWNSKNPLILLRAKDKAHIPYLEQLKQWGEVYIATRDGSLGVRGKITDLFSEINIPSDSQFYNCGSKLMLNAVLPLEKRITKPENIYSALEYLTSCGVGLCGKCSDEKGRRTCVEGPFLSY